MKLRIFLQVSLFLFLSFSLVGCQKEAKKRVYTEITSDSPLMRSGSRSSSAQDSRADWPDGDPHAGLKDIKDMRLPAFSQKAGERFTWSTPKSWEEEKGSGLRLVTFRSKDKKREILCTIVVLGARAGTAKENVERWLRQLGITLNAGELNNFLNKSEKLKTADKLAIELFDLTALTAKGSEDSMAAAILELENETVFIKMTGSADSVKKNISSFKSLCQSFKVK